MARVLLRREDFSVQRSKSAPVAELEDVSATPKTPQRLDQLARFSSAHFEFPQDSDVLDSPSDTLTTLELSRDSPDKMTSVRLSARGTGAM